MILTGHCTPLAMYMALYEHPESVVFLDDCDAMFRNLPALGILRSALWEGEKGKRLVNYNSSQLKVPSSFHFNGQDHFRRQHLAAPEPRIRRRPEPGGPVRAVGQSNEEVLEMMRQLAAQGFEGLSPDECQEVVDFIAEFSATRELSLRLLEPSLSTRSSTPGKRAWTGGNSSPASSTRSARPPLPKVSDSRTYDLECLRQVLEDYPDSVAEQEAAFGAC